MVGGPAGYLGVDPVEAKLGKIEFIHKDVDDTNSVVLADPILQAFGKQCALPAIRALNETLIRSPPRIGRESYRENQIEQHVFTQPGS
jgi:hypothetical protein